MAGLLIGTMAGGGSINARCPRLSRVVSAASLGPKLLNVLSIGQPHSVRATVHPALTVLSGRAGLQPNDEI